MKAGFSISFTIFGFVLSVASFIAHFVGDIDWLFWLSIIIFILQMLVIMFCLFGWRLIKKLPLFKSILPCDLNGKFFGELQFDFEGKGKKPVVLNIVQTLYGIKVTATTNLIRSETITSELKNDGGIYHLIYTYKTNSKMTNTDSRNPESIGTADLVADGNVLEGRYWTTNQTIGKIKVEKQK